MTRLRANQALNSSSTAVGAIARQRVVGQPAAEPGLGRLVERGDREVVDDGQRRRRRRAARPGVAVQRVGAHTDLAARWATTAGATSASSSGKRPCWRQNASWTAKPSLPCSPWSTASLNVVSPTTPTAKVSSSVDHSRFMGAPDLAPVPRG